MIRIIGITLTCIFFLTLLACQNKKDPSSKIELEKSLLYSINNNLDDSAHISALWDSIKVYNKELQNSTKENRVTTLLYANYLRINNKFTEAQSKFQSLLNIIDDARHIEFSALVYRGLAMNYRLVAKRDSALLCYKKSEALYGKSDDAINQAEVLNTIGFLFWEVARFDSALKYFDQSLGIKQNLPDKDSYATTLNNIGTVYYHYAIYDKALEYYFKSLEIQKEVKDHDGTALILANIGLVYKETKQFEKALDFFDEGLSYARKEIYNTTFGYLYQNIGSTYLNINLDSADLYFKKSLKEYSKSNSYGGVIIALKGLGETKLEQSQFEMAKSYFSAMLLLAERENNLLRIGEAEYALALVAFNEVNLERAIEHIMKSINLARDVNKITLLRDNYKLLSELYELQGKSVKALSTYKKYMDNVRMIKDADMEQRLSRLSKEYETEKIQSELEVQKLENERQKLILYGFSVLVLFMIFFIIYFYRSNQKRKTINSELYSKSMIVLDQRNELERVNKDLTASNSAKDRLFSIISHDLKNPFFNLMGNISLLKDGNIDEREKHLCIDSIDRSIKNTYATLENLLHLSQSKIRNVDCSPVLIKTKSFFADLSDEFESQLQYKSLKFNISLESKEIYADPVMLQIICRNLITNSIKFTNKGGKIEICCSLKNKNYILSVSDSGIGMDSEMRKNLLESDFVKSGIGTDGEKGTGIGIGLCKDLITKHQGSLEIESSVGVGSKFIVSLPVSC